MNIINKLKKQTALDADAPRSTSTYFLNDFSQEALTRTKIFTKVAEQNNLIVLPGRYGGEFNNDLIAVKEQNDGISLFLGIKTLGEDGGVQLDTHSMGQYLQCSKPWLSMVVQSLKLSKNHLAIADKIEQSTNNETIQLVVVYIDTNSKQLNMLPLKIQ